ncbi:MAG: hypothetical protein IID30_13635 [Planctomycetes bacterium]|nr:hypothetical protein [Planctomycetota bacterium]
MYRQTCVLFPLIMFLGIAAPCHATITVKDHLDRDISTFRYDLILSPSGSGKWILTLLSAYQSGTNTFNINATNGESFEAIFNDVPGNATIVRVTGATNVDKIEVRGSTFCQLNRVEITGTLGSVLAGDIGLLLIEGDIIGPVVADVDPGATGFGVNSAQSLNGNVLGDVLAVNGKIGSVLASNGTIGTASNPVRIESFTNIITLVGQKIYADVDVRKNGGDGTLRRILTREFHGSLNAKEISSNFITPLYVSDIFDASVVIGGSFTSATQRFMLGEGGIAGQIIFNADNSPTAVWDAPVHIIQPDPTDPLDETLETINDTLAPSYTNTAAAPG